jgi:hypothetical protein
LFSDAVSWPETTTTVKGDTPMDAKETERNCGCEGSRSFEGGIEKNPKCVCELISSPISVETSVVTIRARGDVKFHADGIRAHAGDFIESVADGITTVVFLSDNRRELDLSKILVCTEGGDHYATGDGGVWNARRFSCKSKSCETPCRSASCDTVMSECASHFDSVCSYTVSCVDC